jgi:hypothetical protein
MGRHKDIKVPRPDPFPARPLPKVPPPIFVPVPYPVPVPVPVPQVPPWPHPRPWIWPQPPVRWQQPCMFDNLPPGVYGLVCQCPRCSPQCIS